MALVTATCTLLCALIAGSPGYAEPAGSTVPDAGARPIAGGPILAPGGGALPGGAPVAGPPVLGPLGDQIVAETNAVQMLEQQLSQAKADMDQAVSTADLTRKTWEKTQEELTRIRERADSAAADAYKSAVGLGPFEQHAGDLYKFSIIAPGVSDRPGGEALARQLIRAQQEERAAREAYDLASGTESLLSGRFTTLKTTYDQRSTALIDLRTRNSAEVARVEAERDAYEQSLGGQLSGSVNVDGYVADPKAHRAVEYALAQLGKWYLWGAEGPDRFDCSGLAWAAYRTVGQTVPRVANTMYNGTDKIDHRKYTNGDLLVEGDLLFFSNNMYDWRSISHMGIYVGGGRMIHAPSTGQQVKIAPVQWSRLFGATRIFKAVKAPPAATRTGSASASTSATPSATGSSTSQPTTPPPTTPAPTTPAPTTPPPTTPAPTTPPPTTPPPTTPPPTTPPPTTPPGSP